MSVMLRRVGKYHDQVQINDAFQCTRTRVCMQMRQISSHGPQAERGGIPRIAWKGSRRVLPSVLPSSAANLGISGHVAARSLQG